MLPTADEKQVFLSPPFVGEEERRAVQAAFDSGYVAPCGPQVEAFERALARLSGRAHAVAVSSGTAAMDLLMEELKVGPETLVIAPTLTFVATVGPAWHRGARLAFVDCDATGNIDLALLEQALRELRPTAKRAVVIAVDLYGRCCDGKAIAALCRRHRAFFVRDSAEAVGAKGAGKADLAAIYSFNGNKIITTSGGGAIVTDNKALAERARKRSQQSREPFPWYQHREVGYNYRLSNLLGAVGLAQIAKLPLILRKRKQNAAFYAKALRGAATFLPPVRGENHWLTVALMRNCRERDAALARLAAANIEARPVWKPMHLQPVFAFCPCFGGKVAEDLFARGLCLPSGTGLTEADLSRISATFLATR